ncbi:GNAT family N-acetyltransferase [Microbacterium sp.]|uniref:GNAT family N-acetyltransferase n=1 Tax=Microbacterium sp. TaxID=51671 RepID=UPI003341F7A2
MELAARRMTRDDWHWISEWFSDPTLDRELGPLDEEWLDYVLCEEDGVQLVVADENGPVALVGCVWDPRGAEHGITDLAIDPRRRRSGLGGPVVAAVLSWPGHPPTTGWIAFVDPGNDPALRFFPAIGWRDEGPDGEMRRFARAVPAA